MNALSYGIFLILPATVVLGLVLGGPFVLATPVMLFVITPVLDALLGLDTTNPDEGEEARRAKTRLYDAWLFMIVPVEIGLLLACARVVPGLSPAEAVGLTVSMGLCTGAAGITVAHELMHRPGRVHRALGEVLMLCASYPHFCIEHVLGHHKHVATPRDPGSAARGQNVYAFLPRTLLGSLQSAWALETRRVHSKGVRAFSWGDRRLRMPLSVAAILVAVGLGFGRWGLAFFVGQSVVAFVLLEVINYVEHYGLRRQQDARGQYEKVLPRHSWNSGHRLTGRYLFNLPRHADHHFRASRPYPLLRHMPDSPQMPAGYGTMVLLSLVPPAWFAVMNPRVDAQNALHHTTPHPPEKTETTHDRDLKVHRSSAA